MTDFVTVPRGHTFIMNGRNVIDQVERFLREGSFDHAGRDPRADRGDQTPAGKAGPAVAGEAVRVGIRSRRGYLTHGLRQD